MDKGQQNDTNLTAKKKNPNKKPELMLDLTVVNVESLLSTVHICSSQHATGNCSIYKPKEKKTTNNNRITTTT